MSMQQGFGININIDILTGTANNPMSEINSDQDRVTKETKDKL